MKRIILTTLFSTLFACLLFGLFILVDKKSFGYFVYVTFMMFGSTIIPTLIGVIIFQLIRKRISYISETKTLVVRIMLLLSIFAVGLFLWAVADVIFLDWTLKNIFDDFNSQFLGFTPVALCLAIVIPAFDILIKHKSSRIK